MKPNYNRLKGGFAGSLAAIAGVLLLTLGLLALGDHVNPVTVAMLYLVLIVVTATLFERMAALAASLLATFSFNFFFLPPFLTLNVAEPQNWISLFVFLAVAVTVGQLSATANRRAAEAERLYRELEDAFAKASETEALKRSESLKTALLDAVTHDLRTPLTAIKASVTMLIGESPSGDVHTTLDPKGREELLNVIDEETDRLNNFIESMVELARIRSSGAIFERSRVTAEEVIVKAAQRARLIRSSHKLVSHVEPDLPLVSIDSRAVVEVVYNLLENAAKYSPPGSAIEIRAERSENGVRFSIEDEGPGVPEPERTSVFEKFYRRDATAGSGFGMGLAIVRGIIEAHGGSIWIESGKKGARFVFELPAHSDG